MTFQQPDMQQFLQPKKRRGFWWKVPLIVLGSLIVLLIALGSIGIALGTQNTGDQTVTQDDTADTQAAAQASAQAELERSTKEFAEAGEKAVRDAQRKMDQDMRAQGWEPMGDMLYFAVAPSDQVDCGTIPCSGFSVVSQLPDGCPNGIYLQASFLAEGRVSVGDASEITAPLTQGQTAVFKLHDTSYSATSIEVTKMNCL